MQIHADLYGIVLHVYFCLITLILSWWIGVRDGFSPSLRSSFCGWG